MPLYEATENDLTNFRSDWRSSRYNDDLDRINESLLRQWRYSDDELDELDPDEADFVRNRRRNIRVNSGIDALDEDGNAIPAPLPADRDSLIQARLDRRNNFLSQSRIDENLIQDVAESLGISEEEARKATATQYKLWTDEWLNGVSQDDPVRRLNEFLRLEVDKKTQRDIREEEEGGPSAADVLRETAPYVGPSVAGAIAGAPLGPAGIAAGAAAGAALNLSDDFQEVAYGQTLPGMLDRGGMSSWTPLAPGKEIKYARPIASAINAFGLPVESLAPMASWKHEVDPVTGETIPPDLPAYLSQFAGSMAGMLGNLFLAKGILNKAGLGNIGAGGGILGEGIQTAAPFVVGGALSRGLGEENLMAAVRPGQVFADDIEVGLDPSKRKLFAQDPETRGFMFDAVMGGLAGAIPAGVESLLGSKRSLDAVKKNKSFRNFVAKSGAPERAREKLLGKFADDFAKLPPGSKVPAATEKLVDHIVAADYIRGSAKFDSIFWQRAGADFAGGILLDTLAGEPIDEAIMNGLVFSLMGARSGHERPVLDSVKDADGNIIRKSLVDEISEVFPYRELVTATPEQLPRPMNSLEANVIDSFAEARSIWNSVLEENAAAEAFEAKLGREREGVPGGAADPNAETVAYEGAHPGADTVALNRRPAADTLTIAPEAAGEETRGIEYGALRRDPRYFSDPHFAELVDAFESEVPASGHFADVLAPKRAAFAKRVTNARSDLKKNPDPVESAERDPEKREKMKSRHEAAKRRLEAAEGRLNAVDDVLREKKISDDFARDVDRMGAERDALARRALSAPAEEPGPGTKEFAAQFERQLADREREINDYADRGLIYEGIGSGSPESVVSNEILGKYRSSLESARKELDKARGTSKYDEKLKKYDRFAARLEAAERFVRDQSYVPADYIGVSRDASTKTAGTAATKGTGTAGAKAPAEGTAETKAPSSKTAETKATPDLTAETKTKAKPPKDATAETKELLNEWAKIEESESKPSEDDFLAEEHVEEPDAPVDIEQKISRVTKAAFAKMLRSLGETGRVTPEEAKAIAYIWDRRAKQWVKETGEPIETFYKMFAPRIDDNPDAKAINDLANVERALTKAGKESKAKGAAGLKSALDFVDEGEKLLRFFKKGDVGSLARQSARLFRDSLADPDYDLVRAWEDKQSDGQAFEKAFLDYLRDPESVTGLKGRIKTIFEDARQWLSDIWAALKGEKLVKDSGELAEIFDRMLGIERGNAKPVPKPAPVAPTPPTKPKPAKAKAAKRPVSKAKKKKKAAPKKKKSVIEHKATGIEADTDVSSIEEQTPDARKKFIAEHEAMFKFDGNKFKKSLFDGEGLKSVKDAKLTERGEADRQNRFKAQAQIDFGKFAQEHAPSFLEPLPREIDGDTEWSMFGLDVAEILEIKSDAEERFLKTSDVLNERIDDADEFFESVKEHAEEFRDVIAAAGYKAPETQGALAKAIYRANAAANVGDTGSFKKAQKNIKADIEGGRSDSVFHRVFGEDSDSPADRAGRLFDELMESVKMGDKVGQALQDALKVESGKVCKK